MDLLKQEHEISLAELMKYPVWVFAFDEMKKYNLSGRTMKPFTEPPPIDVHMHRIYTRATFWTANGNLFKGLITPIDKLDTFVKPVEPVDMLPVIITENARVNFWYGIYKPSEDIIISNYRELNMEPDRVFPISFKTDIDVINGIAEGIIQGFLYCIKEEMENTLRLQETDIKVIR